MIDQLVAAGVIDLGISGGEPLLRRDMLEIIAYAKQRGMTVGIASNGAKLSPVRAAQLATIGLNRLQVSLDGFAEQHDKLRRWPGLFHRVLKTIQTARKAGLRVHVCCTVTRLNCDLLEAFVAFLPQTGIKRLNLSRFVSTGRGSDLLDPGDHAWRGIIERCGKLKTAYAGKLEITTHLAQQILVELGTRRDGGLRGLPGWTRTGLCGCLRATTIVTTRSDASRPPVTIDRDQCDGTVRCIADLSVFVRRQARWRPSP